MHLNCRRVATVFAHFDLDERLLERENLRNRSMRLELVRRSALLRTLIGLLPKRGRRIAFSAFANSKVAVAVCCFSRVR